MIISCPSCHTDFEVDDALIPPQGRKLQCSKCKHLWFFKIKSDEDYKELLQMAKNTAKEAIKSSIKATPKSNKGAILLPLLSLALTFFIIFFAGKEYLIKAPVFKHIYQLAHYDNTSKLVIQNVKVEKQLDSGAINHLLIQGEIANKSEQAISAPHLRIRLFDLDNKLLMQEVLPYSAAEVVQAQQVIPINYPMRLRVAPDSVTRVELDVADNLDFWFWLR
ncbi:DUF3426 domain-containing protein [Rickettsiales endosymbiont of Stachyamoeba lipophora]|uniref:DUF3426 domain-containing protein n=1 Tax=Rickettsiales endosymbiont of Stachyamoeba lipophora TaxID=2486578 RepID=UPI000F64E67B|nr:DUF3426 domain-containing protein [Rickettsiales endosymbiont of Stachyamoeba lipophora]AZL15988.1 DUF3426 domain-containing protein [Rickettsiales endosymbiont of Stachyamoeba lipophora]